MLKFDKEDYSFLKFMINFKNLYLKYTEEISEILDKDYLNSLSENHYIWYGSKSKRNPLIAWISIEFTDSDFDSFMGSRYMTISHNDRDKTDNAGTSPGTISFKEKTDPNAITIKNRISFTDLDSIEESIKTEFDEVYISLINRNLKDSAIFPSKKTLDVFHKVEPVYNSIFETYL